MSILCPSAGCQAGAILLGIVLPDGRVAFTGGRTIVDRVFITVARSEGRRAPERRFRFSAPCAEGACRQWTGARCGVITGAMAEALGQERPDAAERELPDCAIRDDCRWFRQAGADACAICERIITETRP